MFTLHDKILKQAGGLFMPLCLAAAFCAGTAMEVHAQPAPPNDDVANAQSIIGSSGTVTGTNLYATAESGEPAPYSNNPAQASIWYLWTAPYTTTMDFNTANSTDPNTGAELDTVLAVYSLTSGATVAFTNMTQVASNENDPSGGVTSRVDFPVTVGTVYLVQVDGARNTSTGLNARGHVVLNWRPSLVAGSFGFSTLVYFAGEYDDYLPFNMDYFPNSVAQSLFNGSGDPNVRITVTRQGGFTGKCEVTLTVTNLTYQNLFETNYVVTNIYTTNYLTNSLGGPGQVIGFTNVYFTNIASLNLFEEINDVGGLPQVVQLQSWNDFTTTQTNYNLTGPGPAGNSNGPVVTNFVGVAGLNPTNFFTNFPCVSMTNSVTTTNNSNIVISVTQVLCLPEIIVTNTTASASNGLDYVAITTNLTFNDFQMSRDVYLQINPTDTNLPGPDWTPGNHYFYGVNSFVYLTLTNPVLDPNEDSEITPPTLTLSSNYSNPPYAYLDILNFEGNPNDYVGNAVGLTTNTGPGDHVTINLERATFRCNRVPDGSSATNTSAYLYAVLTGNPAAGASYTVHYTIDCASVVNAVGTPLNAFQWHRFPTVADSDYAVPSYYTNQGVTYPDFGVPVSTPPDPSFEEVGTFSVWPAGQPYIGSFTIGPLPPNNPYGEIAIPIFTNGAVEFDVDMIVQLFETEGDRSGNSGATVPGFIGNVSSAILTINCTGQPGGAYDTSFNIDNISSSAPAYNQQPGANASAPGPTGPVDVGSVNAIAIQTNGQAVIGGLFFSYNDVSVYSVARLLTNGFLDPNFNKNVQLPGVNYGGTVNAIAIDASGRIIIGGWFSSYDGLPNILVSNIARLNYDGSLDTSFKSGLGFNGPVTALAVDAKSNILVGGDFTSYNTTNCNHIARLLPGGGLDPTFLPNTGNGLPNYGTDQEVETVATDGNGNIILGGAFSSVNGGTYNYVARLLPNGAVDASFNPEIGPDDVVYSVAIQPNNEILIGGAFQNYNLVSRSGVALIATNGSLDTAFVPGSGADGVVYSVVLQPADGNVLVGGQFRNFNTSRRLGVARLLTNGWLDTSFMDTSYNQYAGLINKSYNDPVNIACALALQPDGNILVGGSFTNVGGGTVDQFYGAVNARDAIHSQINITRLIGAPTPGPQTSGGGIGNCPGNMTLTQNPYTVNDTGNSLFVTLLRTNGSLGPAQLTLGTNLNAPGPGAATAADFSVVPPPTALYNELYNVWGSIVPWGTYGWRVSDGYYGYNTNIQPTGDNNNSSFLHLNIYNDTAALQNLFAGLSELNVNSQGLLVLGGVPIPTYPALGLPGATLEILNNNFPPGEVGFSASNYTAIDTSSNVTITVLRTNGSFGTITVYYCTTDGTAESGVNYTGSPSNTPPSSLTKLTFEDGATSATFTIPITKQYAVEPTTQFHVFLYDPNPGGVLDKNIPPLLYPSATVTIIDGNFSAGHLSFTSPTYSVDKGGVATVGVMRSGGAAGELQVQCGTSNGTGTNGINYTGVTNTLSWTNQDVSVKTMSIQTLQDNIVEGLKTVNLSLFNATNIGNTTNASLILTSPSNAVLAIQEIDAYGTLNFAAPNFNIMQNAGQALITVIRTNGTTGPVSVDYTTFNDTNAALLGPNYQPALAGTNYGTASGALIFQSGQTSANFVVPIYYTPNEGTTNAFNRVVTLELYNGSPTAISSNFPVFATLTILDPQLVNSPAGAVDQTTLNGTGFNNYVNSLALQPDGSVLAGGAFTFFNQYPFYYVARLNPSGAFDSSFLFNQAGANGTVLQVLSQTPRSGQTNGSILIAGNFTQVDEVNRGGIARLNLDGSVDETFDPGSGADSTIFAVAETSLPAAISSQPNTLAYYIAGNFANFDGVPSGGIARLNASTNSAGFQGTVDPNFNVGQGVTGSDAAIHAVAVQANGQVILGGDFTSFNSMPYNHLVRLNVDGSVDTGFNPTTNFGPADSVRAIAIQPDGRIIIGGLFTNVGGSNLNYLARLNSADGSVDTNFNVGVGGNDVVLALAIDSQTRILVGGEFTRFSGVTRNGITRLNPDGTVDPTINFETGADGGFVDTIAIQSNDEIDVGGGFSIFEGIAENNFVRLFGGANYGDGLLQFSQAVFGVLNDGTNAVVTIQRLGGEGTTAQPTVSVLFSTSDGTAQAGANYTPVSTNVVFPLGETFETVTIPILNNYSVGSNTTVNLNLSSPVYAALGAQPSAILVISNLNSAVNFATPTYRQSADAPGGNAVIPVVRIGYPDSTVGVTVYTGTSGTATPNVDYTPTTNFIVFNPGVMTNYFLVPMLNPTNLFGDVTVDLEMNNPSNTFIGSPGSETLTIASVYGGSGVLAFSQPSYSIVAPSAGMTNAAITIIRTNGLSNSVVVTLTTSNGTAVAGVEYSSVQTNVNFAQDVASQTVFIPVDPQPLAGLATTVYLTLSNPTDGATIGGNAQEILTILNGIESFTFTNSPYHVSESNGSVTLQIVRNGPAANTAYVNYGTSSCSDTNSCAQPYIDYVPESGTLTNGPNETFTTIPIPIIQGNYPNSNSLTFQVQLSGPLPAGVQVGPTPTATVIINCDVTGFEFSANSYVVGENGGNVVIGVTRLNPDTGVASVQYATSDGSALSNVDYVAASGTLTFQNGQASTNFTVSILNTNIVESNKTFNVTLSNPRVLTLSSASTNAYLLSPSNATVTITNVLTGVSFGSPTFFVSECAGTAVIPVILTGVTNYPVSVVCTTTNGGSAIPGANYFTNSTNFIFQPGQTSTNFIVQVINNNVVGPNHTVYLALSNPTNAVLLNPSTAVLTIQECNGAFIVNSGTAFVSGSIDPASGIIFPNETVTILFGLRDVSVMNATNVLATLQAANGVVPIPAGESQTYSLLIANGPTVAMPFTFEAEGTNGQSISADLVLTEGTNVLTNYFGFTLGDLIITGGATTTFSTNESLRLFGSNSPPSKASSTNAPNYGYPSVIDVSGLAGNITAVTAGITNFGHTYPSNVAMVLAGPAAPGQGVVLMNDCGFSNIVQNLNLTFSQSAGSSLPETTALVSGTYKPTSYGPVSLPPTTTNQAESRPTNFSTNLSTFVGQAPNGNWSLFVADEAALDSGYISNGWSVSITTGFVTNYTGFPVQSDSDLELAMTAAPAAATLNNTLTYAISVTNYGPAVATNVIITDTLPSGVSYIGNSCNCTVGTNGLTNGVLTFALATLAVGNGVAFNIEVIPDALGYVTNIAAATANEPDPNVNNVQTNVVSVSTPTAQMEVTLIASPNSLPDGADVTYAMVVTNNGPSTATGVMATNSLPAGFLPVTITPAPADVVSNASVTVVWNLGAIANGSSSNLSIVAGVFVPETGLPSIFTDYFAAGSAVSETNKPYASVKTQVTSATLNVVADDGPNYSLTWPAAGNYVLQGAVTLSGPWMPIANPPVVDGQYTYLLPGTNGYCFFRLSLQLP